MIFKRGTSVLERMRLRRQARQDARRRARKIIANDNLPVEPSVEPVIETNEPIVAYQGPEPKRRKVKRTEQNAHAPDWALELDA
jgi:CRISPR/Cas system Type II protein with McrA/HNH and RuvC-like nuclease domain